MAKSKFLNFLTGYEPVDAEGGSTSVGKRFFVRSFSGSLGGKHGNLISRIIGSGEGISRLFSATSTKAYGAFLLAFGLVTLALHFVYDYLNPTIEISITPLILGAAFSLVAIPLLLFERPLSILLQDNPVTDFILFEFFCIKRTHRNQGGSGIPTVVLAILGALVGLSGYFLPVQYVALIILTLVYIYLSFSSPEFSFFTSILILPYLTLIPYSDIIFAAIVLVSFLSLMRKVICGKRVYFFEQYDFLIAMMIFFILVSGIFVKGIESFNYSVYMLVMSFGYILASNLVTNRRLADCAMNALAISSIPAAVLSVWMYVSEAIEGNALAFLGRGISSSFPSTQAYSIFLIIAIIISVILLRQAQGALKVLYAISLILNLAALVFTSELFAILSLVFGAVAYAAMRSRRWLIVTVVLILFLIPYTLPLIPDNIVDTVFGYLPHISSKAELISLWDASFEAFSDNVWIGIGMGGESFTEEISHYIETEHHNAHNTFLELGLEAGVFALVCLILTLIVRLGHRTVYSRYLKSSQVSTLSPLIGMCVFVLVFYGATSYIWADMSSFYLFWLVFGIGSAAFRIAKRESDDRILYYEDARDVDYSAIDVYI